MYFPLRRNSMARSLRSPDRCSSVRTRAMTASNRCSYPFGTSTTNVVNKASIALMMCFSTNGNFPSCVCIPAPYSTGITSGHCSQILFIANIVVHIIEVSAFTSIITSSESVCGLSNSSGIYYRLAMAATALCLTLLSMLFNCSIILSIPIVYSSSFLCFCRAYCFFIIFLFGIISSTITFIIYFSF